MYLLLFQDLSLNDIRFSLNLILAMAPSIKNSIPSCCHRLIAFFVKIYARSDIGLGESEIGLNPTLDADIYIDVNLETLWLVQSFLEKNKMKC